MSDKIVVVVLLSCLGLSCVHGVDTQKAESSLVEGPGDFVLLETDGSKTRLSEHLSRVNVLAMWNRYCEPCLKEMSILEKLRRKYSGDSQVVVLSVACEKTSDKELLGQIEKIARQNGLSAKVLVDSEEKLMSWIGSRIPCEKASCRLSGIYPLTAVVDDKWNSMIFAGFTEGDGNDFVDLLTNSIEEARQGKLVGTNCYPDCKNLFEAEAGTPIYLRFDSPVKEGEIPGKLAKIKKYLKEKFPRLSPRQLEQLLEKVKDTMRRGGMVQIGTEKGER